MQLVEEYNCTILTDATHQIGHITNATAEQYNYKQSNWHNKYNNPFA